MLVSPAYAIVRTIVAVLLLGAASLKAYHLATSPVVLLDGYFYAFGQVALCAFELLLAMALITNIRPRVVRATTIGTFGVFAIVSLWKLMSGEASCGCFGSLTVPPAAALSIDLAVILGLLCTNATGGRLAGRCEASLALFAFLSVAFFVSAIIVAGVSRHTASGSFGDGLVLLTDGAVLAKPDEWIGSRFPLAAHIDIGQHLVEGEWVVVLYRRDCGRCRDAISKYEEMARDPPPDSFNKRVALIEVPAKTASLHPLVRTDSVCVSGRLSNIHDWLVNVPLSVRLNRGKVISVE